MNTFERQAPARSHTAHLPPGGRVVLAETDERDDRTYVPVLLAALEIARRSGAQLVLFDRSTASRFTDPYPSGAWTADVDGPRGDRPLDGTELARLGHGALQRQVERAIQHGVPTRAWLARGTESDALAEAVRTTAADVVLLRAERPAQSRLQRLLMRPISNANFPGSSVVTVSAEGEMALREPEWTDGRSRQAARGAVAG
jgi:hypothetical protein